jgi:hypothetical protein
MGSFNFIDGKQADLSKQPFMRMNYHTVSDTLAHSN